MKFNAISLACILVILTVGCGPSGPTYEERQQIQEQERQERISQADAELDAFAQRYNAVSIDFFGYNNSLQGKFTVVSQQELEGKVVGFRGTLLDVRRSSSGVYEAVFGSRYFSSTTLHLTLSSDAANDILGSANKFENEVLVVARVERVARHQINAQVCGEPDCNTISMNVDSFFRSFQIWGQMIDLYIEEPGA